MWKLQNYSVTQILREIKVGEYKVSELTLLAHLETLNFDYPFFAHFEGQNLPNQ